MKITGWVHYQNKENYGFEFTLDTEEYRGNGAIDFTKPCTKLFFECYNYSFSYEFDDIKDFLIQYDKQENNLFKNFFNDNNIKFDTLNFDLTESEWSDVYDISDFTYKYPKLYFLIDDFWTWDLNREESLEMDVEENCKNGSFSGYIKDILEYVELGVEAEYILECVVDTIDVSELSIDNIKELYDAKELEAYMEFYNYRSEFTPDEKEFINLAVNFNNDKNIKVF